MARFRDEIDEHFSPRTIDCLFEIPDNDDPSINAMREGRSMLPVHLEDRFYLSSESLCKLRHLANTGGTAQSATLRLLVDALNDIWLNDKAEAYRDLGVARMLCESFVENPLVEEDEDGELIVSQESKEKIFGFFVDWDAVMMPPINRRNLVSRGCDRSSIRAAQAIGSAIYYIACGNWPGMYRCIEVAGALLSPVHYDDLIVRMMSLANQALSTPECPLSLDEFDPTTWPEEETETQEGTDA